MDRVSTMKREFFCAAVCVLMGLYVPLWAAGSGQPIEFNHWLHVYNGVQCELCHAGARQHLKAGLPSISICRRCHEDVLYEAPEEAKIRTAFEAGGDLPWRPMNGLQPYVYFSHRRHVTLGGRSCEHCHGDVVDWRKPPTKPKVRFSGRPGMAACIACHEESQDLHAGIDCLDCHH